MVKEKKKMKTCQNVSGNITSSDNTYYRFLAQRKEKGLQSTACLSPLLSFTKYLDASQRSGSARQEGDDGVLSGQHSYALKLCTFHCTKGREHPKRITTNPM